MLLEMPLRHGVACWCESMWVAGEGKQAFHVVAPSLPGFAFSSAPTQKGFGLRQIAKCFNQLMLELGYNKYVAQGKLNGFAFSASFAL